MSEVEADEPTIVITEDDGEIDLVEVDVDAALAQLSPDAKQCFADWSAFLEGVE